MKTLSVVIGRFQPVHNGHLDGLLRKAYEGGDHMLLLIGSANRSSTPKNPWCPATRFNLIASAMEAAGMPTRVNGTPRVQYRGMNDFVSNDDWIVAVQNEVEACASALRTLHDDTVRVVLFGAFSDASSDYLRWFPSWELNEVANGRQQGISATDIRNAVYEGRFEDVGGKVPATTLGMLREWTNTPEFAFIQKENDYNRKYRDTFDSFFRERFGKGSGYNAVTVDAIVFHEGRVLLVRRARHPGKGLYAIPGGFLGVDERALGGAIRELKEETGLRVDPSWAFAKNVVYDDPGRSERSRVMTIATGFKVPQLVPANQLGHISNIQSVAGADDAEAAMWVPISTVLNDPTFRRSMFEDHGMIIADMFRRLPA